MANGLDRSPVEGRVERASHPRYLEPALLRWYLRFISVTNIPEMSYRFIYTLLSCPLRDMHKKLDLYVDNMANVVSAPSKSNLLCASAPLYPTHAPSDISA